MTTYALYFFVLIVFHIAIVHINGQESCRPGRVENLTLYDDNLLSWNPTGDCPIGFYLVTVSSEPSWEMLTYTTAQPSIDVGHLPHCSRVYFSVIPISTENLDGSGTTLNTKTPAPSHADLGVSYFNLSPYFDGTAARLEWYVDDEWKACVREFRVVRYNEDDDDIYSLYLLGGSVLVFDVVSCAQYVFTVTALYNLETEGPVALIRYQAPPLKIPPPQLEGLSLGRTTADLTISLPGPDVNRCPVTAVVVESAPYFTISYPINGQNQITRPNMNLHLTNLQPDSMYWLRVTANNTAGFSDPYVIGIQTLSD